MGKFIAKCRKEKELTQEELGSIFNVTGQSVSKWENGITSPDISNLPKLCEVLDISMDELLQYRRFTEAEKNNELNKSQTKKDKLIVDTVKFYEKRAGKKYSKRIAYIVFFCMIIVIAILALYFANNYKSVKIYSLVSLNEGLSFKGKVIFNPNDKLIMISHFEYNDRFFGTEKELKAKKVMVSIQNDNELIISCGNLESSIEEIKPLNEHLNSFVLEYKDSADNKNGLRESDLKGIYIIIKYIDEEDNENELVFDLVTEKEFENSKIFYN